MDPEELLTAPRGAVSDRDRLLAASVLAAEELNERMLTAAQLGKGKQPREGYPSC